MPGWNILLRTDVLSMDSIHLCCRMYGSIRAPYFQELSKGLIHFVLGFT